MNLGTNILWLRYTCIESPTYFTFPLERGFIIYRPWYIDFFFLTPPPPISIPIGEGAQYIMAEIYWMIPSYFQFPLKRGFKIFWLWYIEPYFDFHCYWRWGSKYCGCFILNPPLQTTDSKNLFFPILILWKKFQKYITNF